MTDKPFSRLDLEAVQVSTVDDKQVTYRFVLPIFEGTEALELIRMLLAGANINLTFPDGSKKRVVLQDVPAKGASGWVKHGIGATSENQDLAGVVACLCGRNFQDYTELEKHIQHP